MLDPLDILTNIDDVLPYYRRFSVPRNRRSSDMRCLDEFWQIQKSKVSGPSF